jgi:hypothetical protein
VEESRGEVVGVTSGIAMLPITQVLLIDGSEFSIIDQTFLQGNNRGGKAVDAGRKYYTPRAQSAVSFA